MQTKYYFSIEEPILNNKKVICAFHISGIDKKDGYFFIVDENNQLVLYYIMFNGLELLNFIKDYTIDNDIQNEIKFFQFFEIDDFKEKYTDYFLKNKVLDDQKYIMLSINKMKKDNIYNANNQILGLDGFSVKLKLEKEDKGFYSYCYANDKKYFYIIDFVNSILDELNVPKKYRFEKVDKRFINI